MEVEEGGVDHARSHRSHGRGAAGEVPHPEPPQTQLGVAVPALRGEVGDGVDGLECLPHHSRRCRVHAAIMPATSPPSICFVTTTRAMKFLVSPAADAPLIPGRRDWVEYRDL